MCPITCDQVKGGGCLAALTGEVSFVFPREWKIWDRVEMSREEDGDRSDGEESHGHPETNLVNHLPNQYPALHFLWDS